VTGRAVALALAVGCGFGSSARAARPSESALISRAHADVRSALTSIHLLTTSIQGHLKTLEWDFNGWGRARGKDAAASDFDSWSKAVALFRRSAEAISALTDPLDKTKKRLENSPEVQAAAEGVPDSIAGKIADIRRLRAQYDADANRQALCRARGAVAKIVAARGPLRTDERQTRVLTDARGLLAAASAVTARTRRSLGAPSDATSALDRAGHDRVAARLSAVDEDAEALKTEISRLELFFGLNNLLEESP